jgi:hypothetical protein
MSQQKPRAGEVLMMKTSTTLGLVIVLVSTLGAADVQLQGYSELPGRVPVALCQISTIDHVFDPYANIFESVQGGSVISVPAGKTWYDAVALSEEVFAVTRAGGVEQWHTITGVSSLWSVSNVIDIATGCDRIWLLMADGHVEQRDPASGAILARWSESWIKAAKIHVSDPLEQVVLAPAQGNEVRLYDTSGVLLRTIEGPSSDRCAAVALGPGGVLALADRFSGTVDLFGPFGDLVAQVAPRGEQPGEARRPASVAWRGSDLWILDPSLHRVSWFSVSALDDWVLPVPLVITPSGGSRLDAEAIEFVVLPQFISITPEIIQVEVGLGDGTLLASTDLVPNAPSDTLHWQPAIDWEPAASYRWRVRAQAGDYSSGWSAWSNFSTAGLPEQFELLPNYPNPFNASTVIPLQVPDAGNGSVTLEVFNMLGQRVRLLHDGVLEPGARSVVWDGRDDRGGSAASGTYFIRLLYKEGILTRKAVLLK